MALITPFQTEFTVKPKNTEKEELSVSDAQEKLPIGHPYILYVFNYFSIFCLNPHWIKWDSTIGQYIAVTNLPRKLLSCVITFVGAIVVFWDVYWKSPVKPFVKIAFGIHFGFEVVVHLFTAPISWLILFNLWFRIGKITKWVTKIRELGHTLGPAVFVRTILRNLKNI